MLYKLRFDTYTAEFKALTDADWVELRAYMPGFPVENPNTSKGFFGFYDDVVCDIEGMREIARRKLTVRFAEDEVTENLMWVRLQDRIRALELKKDDTAGQLVNGAGVHIHIPDLALMFIREVMHLNDCCTDNLQSYLDEGWRILAICPPNAQRRPDYILGRSREPRP